MSPPRRETALNGAALSHLWNSANTLFSTAPALSAHLSHTLLFSAGADRVSRLARRLQCEKCDGLLTKARVRVRGARKRTRRSENPATCVVRTCPFCSHSNGITAQTRAEAAQEKSELKFAAEERITLALATSGTSKSAGNKNKEEDRPKKAASKSTPAPTSKKRKRKGKSMADSKAWGSAQDAGGTSLKHSVVRRRQVTTPRPKKRAKREDKKGSASGTSAFGATKSGLQTGSFLFQPLD